MELSQNNNVFLRVNSATWNVFCLLVLLPLASSTRAQMSAAEHASHHGGPPVTTTQDSGATTAGGMAANPGLPAGAGPPAGMGPPGGMAGMGDMMKNMGKPPPKALYPSLMSLPDLTPDKRAEVLTQADERMKSGISLVSAGMDGLNDGVAANDYAAMQAATTKMREGLAQFESGVAAHQAIEQGKPPRDVALQWFRSELSLPQPAAVPTASGLSLFHLSVMVILVLFAVVMIWMYFLKMRRAAALFGRIEAGNGSPPPGAATPLAGSPGPSPPSASPGGKTTPSAAPSPAADTKAVPPAAVAKPIAASTPPPAGAKAAPPVADAKPAPVAAPQAEIKAAPSPTTDAKAAPPDVSAQERPEKIKFACPAPEAREVFLAGTFNGWNPKATPMVKDPQGNWEVAVPLAPGRYEFKFVVDGVMSCEPGCEVLHHDCHKCVPDASGTMNRLIEVRKT